MIYFTTSILNGKPVIDSICDDFAKLQNKFKNQIIKKSNTYPKSIYDITD